MPDPHSVAATLRARILSGDFLAGDDIYPDDFKGFATDVVNVLGAEGHVKLAPTGSVVVTDQPNQCLPGAEVVRPPRGDTIGAAPDWVCRALGVLTGTHLPYDEEMTPAYNSRGTHLRHFSVIRRWWARPGPVPAAVTFDVRITARQPTTRERNLFETPETVPVISQVVRANAADGHTVFVHEALVPANRFTIDWTYFA